MTGGQLMAAAERRLAPYWSMTRSQVYRELPVLAEQGLVRLGKPGPRSSQPYAITAAGKRTFSRWLAENPGRDTIRNPIALRVAFGNAALGEPAAEPLRLRQRVPHRGPRRGPGAGQGRQEGGRRVRRQRAGVRRRLPQGGAVLAQDRPGRLTLPRSAVRDGPTAERACAGSAAGYVLSVVTAADYAEQLKELDATLRNIEAVLDVDRLREDKAQLEEQASAPDLWDDQARRSR